MSDINTVVLSGRVGRDPDLRYTPGGDVRPYLHPERGHDLACAAQNPYQSFECHKTTEHDYDGEAYATEQSKQCAGFLTLRCAELGESGYEDEGFEPSYEIVYADYWSMADAYDRYGSPAAEEPDEPWHPRLY